MYAIVVDRPLGQEAREKQDQALWKRFKTVFQRIRLEGSFWKDLIYLPIQCSPTWRLPPKKETPA